MSDYTEAEIKLGQAIDAVETNWEAARRYSERLRLESMQRGYLIIGRLRMADDFEITLLNLGERTGRTDEASRTLIGRRQDSQCGSVHISIDSTEGLNWAAQHLLLGSEREGGGTWPGIIIPGNRMAVSWDGWQSSYVRSSVYKSIIVNDIELF